MVSPQDGVFPQPRGPRVPGWLFPAAEEGAAPAARICPICGEIAPPGSVFCPRDGQALTATLVPLGARSLTVVFTDIEDSVRLTDRLGDARWARIVDEHNDVVRRAIERLAGFEVKVTGDGFLIVFGNSVNAVRCAIDVQRRVTAHALASPDWPVRVRIGVHEGDVIIRPGGDVLGSTVNMAERIMGKAAGGEIWTSDSVYTSTHAVIPEPYWIDRGMRRLRGVRGRQHLYEVHWAREEALPGALSGPAAEKRPAVSPV